MQNYNGQDYIWLFNNLDIDLSQNTSNMIILNNQGQLIINDKVISIQYLLFSTPYTLFGSDINNIAIETKITNDYINDNWINGNKLMNLLTWKILFSGVNNLIFSDW